MKKATICAIILVLAAMLILAGFTSKVSNERYEVVDALESAHFSTTDGEIYNCTVTAVDGDPNGSYYHAEYDVENNIGHICCYGLVTEVWTDIVTGEEVCRTEYFSNEQWDVRYDFSIHDWVGFNFEPYII